jgi:hypothetical protein
LRISLIAAFLLDLAKIKAARKVAKRYCAAFLFLYFNLALAFHRQTGGLSAITKDKLPVCEKIIPESLRYVEM